MQIMFQQQDNAIFYHLQSSKELLEFHDLNYVLIYMYVLFICITYYLIQTFSSLFYLMENLSLSNYIGQ